nr:immunoglobulin light chain junction region [Macaca mulatta]
TLQSKHSYIF